MPKKHNAAQFKIGPFYESEERLLNFSSNLYISQLYQQTISELVEAEKELNDCIDYSTKEEIKILRDRVVFLEAIVAIASENFSSPQEKDTIELEH